VILTSECLGAALTNEQSFVNYRGRPTCARGDAGVPATREIWYASKQFGRNVPLWSLPALAPAAAGKRYAIQKDFGDALGVQPHLVNLLRGKLRRH
jgi:hypothetical protein